MPPESRTDPGASVVILATLIPPASVVAPPLFTVRSYNPLAPPFSATAPPPVLVRVVLAPNTAASLYVCAPLVVTVPGSCTDPPASVVRLARSTAPPSRVAPDVFTARSNAPDTPC